MNKLFKTISKYNLITLISLIIILILTGVFLVHEKYPRYYLSAKFNDSGPLYKKMPVYYKGVLIGQIKEITISQDYKSSIAKIEFYPKKPIFYDNIVAKAKKIELEDDYIDLIYPDPPSSTALKSEAVIEGRGAFDMDLLLSDVADAEIMLPLFEHLSDLLVSANQTSNEITNFFADSRSVLKDSRQNLKQTSKNLAVSTKSIEMMAARFNNYISDNKVKNTTSNIDKSSDNIIAATENLKKITANVDCATRNIDKTIAKIDSTISNANSVASNANVITSGFCQILRKRFAGLRIMFGKVISNNSCQK